MKSLNVVAFETIANTLDRYDAIIDVRSEAEFADDHLPGAMNCPVLTNDERARVGTLFKQQSPFIAKKVGAALVARNLAGHLETHFLDRPKEWWPLIYCWRGGNRSGAMATVFSRIGWQVDVLDGGYKTYRRQVLQDLAIWPPSYTFRVLCGPTGSGKSRLLQELAGGGAQVLDLEGLAQHRGSVLGNLPTTPQPSQKTFESRLWSALRTFDVTQPVFVESESKKVGSLHIPDALMERIRGSECVELHTAPSARIELLLAEYEHFRSAPLALCQQLAHLTPLHGNAVIAEWTAMAQRGEFASLVADLLTRHYDPVYLRSTSRNFSRFGHAAHVEIAAYHDSCFAEGAQQLLSTASATACGETVVTLT